MTCDHGIPKLPDADALRGQYLCEVCEAAMTDEILPAPESPTGDELASCKRCAVQRKPR